MGEKNAITSNGKKLYLAAFELISGQYGQMFEKAFYAKNEKQLGRGIHKYLNEYYGEGNTSKIEGNVYYYFDGEVAVKKHRWEQITGFEQLVNRLL